MVDCIVSSRECSLYSQIPRREILPQKSIVISPPSSLSGGPEFHNVTSSVLNNEITKKLLIANATHTAIASGLCLDGFNSTASITDDKVYLEYLDNLFESEILPTVMGETGLDGKCRTH